LLVTFFHFRQIQRFHPIREPDTITVSHIQSKVLFYRPSLSQIKAHFATTVRQCYSGYNGLKFPALCLFNAVLKEFQNANFRNTVY